MYFRQRWLTAFIILQVLLELDACPSTCKCMWKGGKQTVECINGKLITIPDGVDPGTQVLEFSENNLQVLPRERFQRMGLLHLQRIYLARCRISQIDDRAFKGLSNLIELDLSHNLLNSVPTETFSDYPSLMRLTFSGNPINQINTNAFTHLIHLTTLELSNCQIEVIEPQGFAGLLNLEWLKLDGNRLRNIQGDKTLPESLHGILLHHNPWQCDCRLMDVYLWLITYSVPQPQDPRCVGPPRVKGETIRSLELDDLACLPDVSPTTLYLEIAEGKNVSLLCRVSAIPEARVSWWFQGRILQNDSMVAPGVHLYYFLEEGTEEKRSELFIFNTNTNDNGTFVCVAENPAGKSQSNYTIRIVVKEEPIIDIVIFSYEYVVTVSATCSVLLVLLVTCAVLCAIRCQRSRRRRLKKERSKTVLQQEHHRGGKITDDTSKQIERFSTEHITATCKLNGDVETKDTLKRDLATVASDGGSNVTNAAALFVTAEADFDATLCESHSSLRNYALEQNPDLINDTESVCKERRFTKRSDSDSDNCGRDDTYDHSGNNSYQEAMEDKMHDFDTANTAIINSTTHKGASFIDETKFPLNLSTLPRGSSSTRNLCQHHHAADVHLSPGRFLDSDGYPIDYGLPKLLSHMPLHSTIVSESSSFFYRTLPHKRPTHLTTPINVFPIAPKAATNTVPSSTFSAYHPHTAEIFTSSTQSYGHYSPSDIRYTVEGYPCSQPKTMFSMESHISFPDVSYLPSPPAPYKGEPSIPPTNERGAEESAASAAHVDASRSKFAEEQRRFWAYRQGDFHIQDIQNSKSVNKDSNYQDLSELSQCCVGSQENECTEVEDNINVIEIPISKKPVEDTKTLINAFTDIHKGENIITEI